MQLTTLQVIIIILAITIGTMLTRFIPFILFPETKEPPQIVHYLGNILPPAMMGLLVVYCLREVKILEGSHGLPELIAIAVIAILHKWKNNILLSILGGTVCYMLLIRFLF